MTVKKARVPKRTLNTKDIRVTIMSKTHEILRANGINKTFSTIDDFFKYITDIYYVNKSSIIANLDGKSFEITPNILHDKIFSEIFEELNKISEEVEKLEAIQAGIPVNLKMFDGGAIPEDILPDHLKINSDLSNKFMKQVIPNLGRNYFNDSRIETTTDKFTGSFTATYKGEKEIKLKFINDINKLVKEDKFNKFYDFMLYFLDQNGLDNGYLRLSYKLWLQYTGRKYNERMVKAARKEIRDFMEILKCVNISFKGKSNMTFDSIPYSECDTVSYKKFAELTISEKFVQALGKDFYTLPLAAGGLSQRAYNLVTNMMWYCKANRKVSGKPFNNKYKQLCEWAGLPDHEYIKEHHNRRYGDFIYTPMDRIIAEIREILPNNIEFNKYFIPGNKDDILKNVSITVFDIDYSNIIKLHEKNKKKNERKQEKQKELKQAKA